MPLSGKKFKFEKLQKVGFFIANPAGGVGTATVPSVPRRWVSSNTAPRGTVS